MKKKLNAKTKLEKRLDEALEATFPCSDPVSINQPGGVSGQDAIPVEKTSADRAVRAEKGGRMQE